MPSTSPSMEVMSRRKRAVIGALLGLGVALLFTALRDTVAMDRPELALVDARTRTFVGTRAPDPNIVLVTVTEDEIRRAATETEGQLRAWPWQQDIQAAAATFMKHAKVKALVLDFLYLDRGRSPEEMGATWQGSDPVVIQWHDEATVFGEAIQDLGRTVVGVELVEKPTWQLPGRERQVAPQLEGWTKAISDVPSRLSRSGAELPVNVIGKGAHTLGFVTVRNDDDGVIRSGDVVGYFEGEAIGRLTVPSLAFAGAHVYADGDTEVYQSGSVSYARVGEAVQRLGDDGAFLVNFRAPPYRAYQTESVYDMVYAGILLAEDEPLDEEAQALADRLEGKIVIWGASFAADLDVIATPLSPTYLGPEFHATLIDNLLHGDGRVRVTFMTNALVLLALCVLLGVLSAIDRSRLRPYLVALAVAVAYVGAAFGVFRMGWSVDMFTPVVGIFVTAVATAVFRLSTEGRRNKWLESTFSRYLAPDVIDALKTDPARLQLGGRRAQLTIFFSDVAGFTSLSEALEPEQVVMLLNRYLTGQSAELMDQNGVIDKFEGDAIMAFFGDPLDTPTHAIDGCRAAVNCRKALPQLESVWRGLGLESFDFRIGLNSGPALVGNMGSESRFDYTCMGDTVNLAARLEGANKVFGSKILLGPQTYEESKDAIVAKPLADLVVVGKTEAVSVYELFAMDDDATDEERAHVAAFTRAHEALRAGDVRAARAALDEAGEANPGDGPVAWLRGIADGMEAGEFDTPWDGRLVMSRK